MVFSVSLNKAFADCDKKPMPPSSVLWILFVCNLASAHLIGCGPSISREKKVGKIITYLFSNYVFVFVCCNVVVFSHPVVMI